MLASKLCPGIRQPSVAALITCEAVETMTDFFNPKVQIRGIARKPDIFVNGGVIQDANKRVADFIYV
jgi:hypothetical protein